MSEVELYRAVAVILVAALGTLGVYLGKRTPAVNDPAQNKRDDFDSLVEAMGKMLDRRDVELTDCKGEHRRECEKSNATITDLERRLQVRRDNEHRLNNQQIVLQERIQVLLLELDTERRLQGKGPWGPPNENGDPQ